jgi:hypothetical protein
VNPDTIIIPKERIKASTGSTRPKEVYVLRSDKNHDSAGVWHKVFMCYNGNTVTIVEFENGVIDKQQNHSYQSARTVWQNCIDGWWHRDDTCIKGLPLGDVEL